MRPAGPGVRHRSHHALSPDGGVEPQAVEPPSSPTKGFFGGPALAGVLAEIEGLPAATSGPGLVASGRGRLAMVQEIGNHYVSPGRPPVRSHHPIMFVALQPLTQSNGLVNYRKGGGLMRSRSGGLGVGVLDPGAKSRTT